ncbi:MAG: DUF4367 domain-containing protein [Candidatus Saccharibacteria bacterium]|nr:DUF4367 domain-containing protein [Candidatus Saccharibacteria bacterium]
MKNDKVVIINGRKYDKDTGLPMEELAQKSKITNDMKSKTTKVARIIIEKPKALYSHASLKTFNDIRSPRRKNGHNMDISKSKHVTHFTPDTSKSSHPEAQTKKGQDIKPISHPLAAKVSKQRALPKSVPAVSAEKSSKEIKQEVIAAALKKSEAPKTTKKSILKRNKKYLNIFTISAAVLIVVGSIIYLNMPIISVKVASMQAGIDATFPEYHPDGYSLSGPVSYSNGEVTINFHANSGNSQFAIKQSKSPLDSSALKIQVDKSSDHQTSESQEGGLTIYTYNDNNRADWVNGGILYSISGDAKLSSDQIRHIATSL